MGKADEKQKRRPKFKDKKQSERFKEAARQLGADHGSDPFDHIVDEMARLTQRHTSKAQPTWSEKAAMKFVMHSGM
jgi:hypothetical protein